jgi:hypothetical protein
MMNKEFINFGTPIISSESGEHINNPLLGKSCSLFGKIWIVVLQLKICIDMGVDLLESQTFILRYKEIPNSSLLHIYITY